MYVNNKFKNKKIFFILIIIFLVLTPSVFFIKRYMDNREEPFVKMVSGTEYVSGEDGQVIVRINDRKGDPLRNAICRATVLYPDKNYFLIEIPMIESTVPGNYYADFITPDKEGVYEETITCIVVANDNAETLKISSSFHVSKALNYVVNMSNTQDIRYEVMMNRIEYIEDSLNNVKEDIQDTKQTFEDEISTVNTTVDGKFKDLYSNMAEAMGAMADVYSSQD